VYFVGGRYSFIRWKIVSTVILTLKEFISDQPLILNMELLIHVWRCDILLIPSFLPFRFMSGLVISWCNPCTLPFLKFYLFYGLFLHLTDVSKFYSAISVYPFVSYLRPTGCTSSFILHSSTIKTHVHRKPRTENPPQT
jgi:hypothetical protein